MAPSERWLSFTPSKSNESISIARSSEQMAEIGRLRYALYIARDKKRYIHVDHERQSMIEAIDDVSLNFQIIDNNRTLAAVRLTRAADALNDPQLSLLVKSLKRRNLSNIVVNSRFVALPLPSARRAIAPMFQEVYRAGLAAGAMHCYLATRPQLQTIFEKFGFRFEGSVFDDPIAGHMHALRFDLHDIAYLNEINSPLLPVVLERFSEARRISIHDPSAHDAAPPIPESQRE